MHYFTKEEKEIEIRCFGKLSIYVGGIEQSAQMNSMKARELIAFLLTYKGEAVKKVTVCDALWGEKPLEHSMDCLYKLIKKVESMPIPFLLRNTRGMVQLCLDNVECDIVTFEQLLAEEDNVKRMEWAVKLYRGMLYEEEDYNWICLKDGLYDNKYWETLDYLEEYYMKENNKRKFTYYKKLKTIY